MDLDDEELKATREHFKKIYGDKIYYMKPVKKENIIKRIIKKIFKKEVKKNGKKGTRKSVKKS